MESKDFIKDGLLNMDTLKELMKDLAKSAEGNVIRLAEVVGGKWDRKKAEEFAFKYFGNESYNFIDGKVSDLYAEMPGKSNRSEAFKYEDFYLLKTADGAGVFETLKELPGNISREAGMYLDKGLLLVKVDTAGIEIASKEEALEMLDTFVSHLSAYASRVWEDHVFVLAISGADKWLSEEDACKMQWF